jgi:predicted nicotinamide N-methyase
VELVETTVAVGELALTLEHPPDAEALIDEEAFEQEEFLPYWAELWPSAVALGRHVIALDLEGVGVLELGCGLALPSIVTALRGARTLATDWSPDALPLARRNAARNGVELETALLSWLDPGELPAPGRWSLVLAADVLYERRNVAPLLDLLPRLGDEVLLADPGRPALPAFLDNASAAWEVEATTAPELPRGAVFRLTRR